MVNFNINTLHIYYDIFLLPNVKNKLSRGFSSTEETIKAFKSMYWSCLKLKGKHALTSVKLKENSDQVRTVLLG